MSKLLFFDIDGTLVDFGKDYMPESTVKALKKAQANGHKCFLCTGRSRNQIYDFLKTAGFDGIVAAAGGYVEYNGEVIENHVFGVETLKQVLDIFKNSSAGLILQNKVGCVMKQEWQDPFMRVFAKTMGIEQLDENVAFSNMTLDEDVEGYPERYPDIESIIYCEADRTVDELKEILAPLGVDAEVSSFKDPDPYSGELTLTGVNKATGIQAVMKKFDASIEDVIGFGDGANDVDMLKFAGVGVAMGNAQPCTKEVADFITKDINEDGLVYAMEELGLI